jgi:hypothetical protein
VYGDKIGCIVPNVRREALRPFGRNLGDEQHECILSVLGEEESGTYGSWSVSNEPIRVITKFLR